MLFFALGIALAFSVLFFPLVWLFIALSLMAFGLGVLSVLLSILAYPTEVLRSMRRKRRLQACN